MNDGILCRPATGGEAVGDDDQTARSRIRAAALEHFAEEGFERATIRGIAHTAGVSHGMLRHHFGSKVALRSACDDYVVEVLRRLNALILDAPAASARSQQASKQFWRYAARSLVDGSPTAAPIFDELVTMTGRWLRRPEDPDSGRAADQADVRAPLLAAMATAIPLFHEHLTRAIGVDIFAPEGDRLITLALRDICAPLVHDDAGRSTSDGACETTRSDRP
jgi:TetR/AcrR family transcriptional regulator, regulator of cefoperazone and chloramphenicol sensitivity